MEYIDSYIDHESGYSLELEYDSELDQYWVSAILANKPAETASLLAANDWDEIGELWLGQFPNLSNQVSKWAGEYL